jgi:hypothetical protein
MRSCVLLSVSLAGGCFLLLVSVPSAKAQCDANTVGYGDVGVVANNPFHADEVVTPSRSHPPRAIVGQRPLSVARDSQGRVRIERVGGDFKHDNGPETGSQVQEHTISICDPVAETLIRMNTLTATATIIHVPPSAPRAAVPPPATQLSFCASRLPSSRVAGRFQVQDLGDQIIEGVEAHGQRLTLPMLGAIAGEESPSGESTSERWCSDSLSAMVLTVSGNTKTGVRSTLAMRNIERTEPDPGLFQIPSGYAITESVAGPREHRSPAPTQNDQQP